MAQIRLKEHKPHNAKVPVLMSRLIFSVSGWSEENNHRRSNTKTAWLHQSQNEAIWTGRLHNWFSGNIIVDWFKTVERIWIGLSAFGNPYFLEKIIPIKISFTTKHSSKLIQTINEQKAPKLMWNEILCTKRFESAFSWISYIMLVCK